MTPKIQRTLVTALIIIGVLFIGFFGLRTLRAFREFRGHRPPPFAPEADGQRQTDVALIREWMTIGFVSHSYRTPPKMLYDALDISPKGNEEKSLKQLNEEYFPDKPGYVLETVKATILATLPPTAIPPATAISPATAIPPASP
jgi:hypothetical protein